MRQTRQLIKTYGYETCIKFLSFTKYVEHKSHGFNRAQ